MEKELDILADIDEQIDQLINEAQYQYTDREKAEKLLPIIKGTG